uniref:Uncharacterized protein n=1 Tax=Romanomermis culicivorax TaxID=13658 RepID=A0A915JMW7_ROMCU
MIDVAISGNSRSESYSKVSRCKINKRKFSILHLYNIILILAVHIQNFGRQSVTDEFEIERPIFGRKNQTGQRSDGASQRYAQTPAAYPFGSVTFAAEIGQKYDGQNVADVAGGYQGTRLAAGYVKLTLDASDCSDQTLGLHSVKVVKKIQIPVTMVEIAQETCTCRYDAVSNKKYRQLMNVEAEFQKLEHDLKLYFGHHWSKFENFMTDRMREHLKSQTECDTMPARAAEEFASGRNSPPAGAGAIDQCVGKGSLTESEYLLHQALDYFNLASAKRIDEFHNRAHKIFSKTRTILDDLDLLQYGEKLPQSTLIQMCLRLERKNSLKR